MSRHEKNPEVERSREIKPVERKLPIKELGWTAIEGKQRADARELGRQGVRGAQDADARRQRVAHELGKRAVNRGEPPRERDR